MAGKLAYTVYMQDGGDIRGYGPNDDVPEAVARQIGAHAWEDGQHPYPDDADGDGQADRQAGDVPARSGKGSGRDAWAAFCAEKDIEVSDEDTRDDLIRKCEEAGVIDAG